MTNEIKEIYLSNLEWTKTHDNMGGVIGNVIFKDNISYEEYNKLFKSGYFILCDKDYITNLEEENKFLKLNNPEANIEHFRIIKENKRKIDNLRKEIKKLKQENKSLENQLDFINYLTSECASYVKILNNKQAIINKALNYIKNESWFCYKDNEEVIDRTPVEELIKILKGDNND